MLGMTFRALHMEGKCPTTKLHLQHHAHDFTVMVFPVLEKRPWSLMESSVSLALLFPLLSAEITGVHPSWT